MEDSVVVWDTGMDGAESDRFCVNERERELGSREVVHVLYGGPKRIGGERCDASIGCDASILRDSTATNQAEKDGPPNMSVRSFYVIDEAEAKLELVCPRTVSCVDIIAISARDVVAMKDIHRGFSERNDYWTKKMFPGLEGFPNHTENATDVQDGMDRLSKLLDSISSVHNEAVFIGYLLITIIIDDPVSLERGLNVVVNHYSLFQVPISINYRLLDDQREGVRF
ncbi:hypothetical protein JHK85_057347 [Glycine max]|nr:hypothetical protein JHK85_057347 [Glycine max]